MVDLQNIRDEIDNVDLKIVELFEKRMKLANQVAESKRSTGKAIYDKEREDAKIAKLVPHGSNHFNQKAIEELFLQLMSLSRRYQYHLLGDTENFIEKQFRCVDQLHINEDTKVVYQGVPGAYSEQSAVQYFGKEVHKFHVDSFKEVLLSLEQGDADFGILPIENSSAGSVAGIFELLSDFENICIVDEEIVKVNHALLGIKGAKIEDIKEVYSHPQGLLQCAKFLEEYPWEQKSVGNTAASALKVYQDNDKYKAAIASEWAAKLYHLQILKHKINFEEDNSTRFVILSKEKVFRKDATKISICFSLPGEHESGTLYNMLSNFMYNDLSMINIQSRPLPNKQWEYRFFIDFMGNLNRSSVKNALTAIKEEGLDVKILGNF